MKHILIGFIIFCALCITPITQKLVNDKNVCHCEVCDKSCIACFCK